MLQPAVARFCAARFRTLSLWQLQHQSTTTTFTQGERQWPVVIVGAGPTGLTLSTLLSQLKVRNLVVERASSLTSHPQAHFINCRTMEIFRQMPSQCPEKSLADEVGEACPPLGEWRKFIYCQTMHGPFYGEVDHFKDQVTRYWQDLSPEGVAHVPQNKLLPMLHSAATALQRYGSICMGQSIVNFVQDNEGIVVSLKSSASQERRVVRCKFLIGADGARSWVRDRLKIPMAGNGAIQHLVNIHFFAPALAERLRAENPAMLYFVYNKKVAVVVVAHDLKSGEFVAQVPYFPPVQTLSEFTEQHCRSIVSAATGNEAADIKIMTVKSWIMGAQVAARFQAGGVFLAGDAAHQFPPAGGFGMNTGVQDAHNLAWKLAHALQARSSWSSARLLDSYTAERRPIALANTALSVANFEEAMQVPKALGLYPSAASLLSSAASVADTILPDTVVSSSSMLQLLSDGAGLGQRILKGGVALGHASSGTEGFAKAWRRKNLDQIFQSGSSLRLQFPKEDLGFAYKGPAATVCHSSIVQGSDGTFVSHPGTNVSSNGGADVAAAASDSHNIRCHSFTPSAVPGYRLPHIELELFDGRRCSILDLIQRRWLLILSLSSCSELWEHAVSSRMADGVCIAAIHIVRSRDDLKGRTCGPVMQVVCDVGCKWATLSNVREHGAVLVRPDGHVAWQCSDLRAALIGLPDKTSTQRLLDAALMRVLSGGN